MWKKFLRLFKPRDYKSETEFRLEQLRKEHPTDDHLISVEQLCDRYQTSFKKGLSDETAQELLKKNGLNQLTPAETKSRLRLFLGHLFGGLSAILWIGAVLCIVSYCISHNMEDVSSLVIQTLNFIFFVSSDILGMHSYIGQCLHWNPFIHPGDKIGEYNGFVQKNDSTNSDCNS